MKILNVEDCAPCDPPCSCFVFMPETESDRHFVAELTDLPTANRMPKDHNRGLHNMTMRVAVSSLSAQMSMPAATDAYRGLLMQKVHEAFSLHPLDLLERCFLVRTFHW